VGPGKDCGYENTIVKAIAGVPITQEGKTSTCAHSDLMGNLVMQCCDLWSNESVEYHGEFGGTTVQCWSETLAYDCALMNVALESGMERTGTSSFFRQNRDPQGYVLAYDNAYRVGQAIAKTETTLPPCKGRCNRVLQLIESGVNSGKLRLTRSKPMLLQRLKPTS
jgi:methanol--5-hydroxybenzimidazolylcobamide Co-methyltransferase